MQFQAFDQLIGVEARAKVPMQCSVFTKIKLMDPRECLGAKNLLNEIGLTGLPSTINQ